MKEIIALLPMKGHSERISNKNMKYFNQKPLYHSIMKSLLESKYVKKIVVDTDSENIRKDVESNFDEVQIIDRPIGLQGDAVSMNTIINYDLSNLEGEHFLQTHSTNPLLTSITIDKAIENYFMRIDKYDSLFSVTRIQSRLYWENASPINHNPCELLRTQDLSPVYEENSNLYLFSKGSFKKADGQRIGKCPQLFEINKLESIDIDEPEDFLLAEVVSKQLE